MQQELTAYDVKQLNHVLLQFSDFVTSPGRSHIACCNRIQDFTSAEPAYFKSKLSLAQILKVKDEEVLPVLLSDPEKENVVDFLMQLDWFSMDTNGMLHGKTCFEIIAEKMVANERYYGRYQLQGLFEKGYSVKSSDGDCLKRTYGLISSQDHFDNWCICRFAYLLNDARMLKLAIDNPSTLFTILSFKMGKPVGFRYPNLIQVANNALTRYRESGDLIMKALHHFRIFQQLTTADKKGGFKRCLEEYELYRPIQNKEMERIILKIFPELS